MQREALFRRQYNYVVEGSSRQVLDNEVTKLNPIWYFPHHAVWHSWKPEEPRLVFDWWKIVEWAMITGTRKYQHLNGSNPPIQSRWRYSHGRHQENVSPGVRSTTGSWRICYLWRPNGDIWTEPKTYQMLVHIFGAKSSPSCILGLLCRQLTQIICQRRTCKRHKKVSRFAY